MELGFLLAGRRKQLGVTQSELASELGCQRETLGDVERGEWPHITQECYDRGIAALNTVAERKREVVRT